MYTGWLKIIALFDLIIIQIMFPGIFYESTIINFGYNILFLLLKDKDPLY